MKFVKTIVTVAAISLLTVPAMASNSTVQKDNNTPGICHSDAGCNLDSQLLARGGGKGKGSGNGGGKGLGNGNGPGSGTGNGGNGPKDGTGNGSKTGECVNA